MKPFLTAQWLNLINLSYAVDPDVLLPFLPEGVELDILNGKAFVSLVPFQFEETRFLGIKFPFHTSFSEFNLRFYVHYKNCKGVVFIREFSPNPVVNFIANTFYREHYQKAELVADVQEDKDEINVRYCIRRNDTEHILSVKALKTLFIPAPQSIEYFLEHRFYGFSGSPGKNTELFRVDHPEWELYTLYDFKVDINFEVLFGKQWTFLHNQDPVSIMLIKGSPVKMFPHERLITSGDTVKMYAPSLPSLNQ
jgi:uncharacterized protein YqjF (DUF2071 family)